MDSDRVKALINDWLEAQLEIDADIRDLSDAPTNDWAVVGPKAPGSPAPVLQILTHEDIVALIETHGAEFDAQLPKGQSYVKRGSEKALATKLFWDARREGISNFEFDQDRVALQLVRELFSTWSGAPVEGTPEFTRAVRLMLKAQADLQKAIIAREDARWRRLKADDPAEGYYPAEMRAPIPSAGPPIHSDLEVSPPMPPVTSSNPDRMQFRDAAYKALDGLEKEGVFGPGKRRADYEAAIQAYIWWHGSDPYLDEITSASAGRYRMDLPYIPSNITKLKEFRGLSAPAVVVLAKEKKGISFRNSNTINNKYLRTLNRIFLWLKSSGLVVVENPFSDISVSRPKRGASRKARRNFTDNEVARLLALPIFTGSAGGEGKDVYVAGNYRIDDWRFWIPLICLYSGLRLNEACGLRLADFKEHDGIHYIHVRDEGDEQRVKTAAAIRRVPVHSALIQVGLLRRVEVLRKLKAERLFEDLLPDASGYLSTNPSKWLGRLIDRIEESDASEPGALTMHSSRHTVITKMRSANIRQDVAEDVVGHEGKASSVHAGYGQVELSAARDAINSIHYDGVALDRIKQP